MRAVPGELKPTVKAYLALKLAGDSPDAPHLVRARRRVHALGGLERTNSFTRFYLAVVGAVGWDLVPARAAGALDFAVMVRAEPLPDVVVDRVPSSSPLTIIYAVKPRSTHLPQAQVDELFCRPC